MSAQRLVDVFPPANGVVVSSATAGVVDALGRNGTECKPRTSSEPSILIVDNDAMKRKLLKATLKSSTYRMFECTKASEAMQVLETENIDLIVLDLMLPEVSGPDLCRWLKTNRKTHLIPVLMLTSVQGVENEIIGISSGADEFLITPIPPTIVRTRIRAMLRNKALIDSLEEAETILFALAQAVEQRDKFTGLHCQRLAYFSVMMGEALKLPPDDLTALYRGGFLHDIGKVGTPDAILFKNGKLTEAEWEVMRAHTTQGEAICKTMKSLTPVLPIIRSHHEKWDGSGYPDGLAGENIPLLARILQVVDIFDALTTARSYKPAYSQEQALRTLQEEARRGWRDPRLVELFTGTIQGSPELAELASIHHSLNNMRVQLLA